ncbi:MAG: Na+/H+ antiporter subunit E [Sphingobacteriia bacterium]|nr:Na+/H+ antiporter subunit E [Sphingobacteriia bacterium]
MFLIVLIFNFLIWYILSGLDNIVILTLGITSSFLASFIGMKCTKKITINKVIYSKLFLYFLWLFKEIILSTIYTLKKILRKNQKIKPFMKRIKSSNVYPLGNVIYDNSITLTPGTVCVEDNEHGLIIHGIDKEVVEALEEGVMELKVKKLFKNDNI